jgi:2-polyprenyl-3-methyl-5-hydroxy-6-metoxy-1,4-benzoquinol methylase
MPSLNDEKKKQDTYEWERSVHYNSYNSVLGHFQALSCIENGHGPDVLDLPCGDGLITEIFSKHFDSVVGVDASAPHLAKARERLPIVEFHESLIEDLELDKKFDSIFMINVLEHVQDPAFVLNKAASLLKPEGSLIVHVPNATAINRKIAVAMGSLESCEELSPFDINIAGHRRAYTLETLTKEFEDANMTIEKTGGVFYKMLSTPQMDWLLANGPWEEGGFGWGRVGAEKSKNWKDAFCQACYEIGKERPEDCNIVYIVAKANKIQEQ